MKKSGAQSAMSAFVQSVGPVHAWTCELQGNKTSGNHTPFKVDKVINQQLKIQPNNGLRENHYG
jgi:hypothetical protein